MLKTLLTLILALQHGRRFGGKKYLLCVFGKCSAFLTWQDELAEEACSVADIIVLVILGKVEDILAEQLCLLTVCDT